MRLNLLGVNNLGRRAKMEKIVHCKLLLPLELTALESANKKNLSPFELLEISNSISLYYAPKISETIKKLTLFSIDPQHLYSYWNLIEDQPGILSQSLLNNELVLKVFTKTKKGETVKTEPIAEINIKELQANKKIKIPNIKSTVVYTATIGRIASNKSFVSLVKSNNVSTFQDNNSQDNFISLTKTMNDIDQTDSQVAIDLSKSTLPKKTHFASGIFSGQHNFQAV